MSSPLASPLPVPLTKNQSSPVAIHRGGRARLKALCYKVFYRIFFAVERLGGARIMPLLMAPHTLFNMVKRRREYALFVEFRNVMPPKFWKGIGPKEHYLKMIRVWYEFMGMAIAYPRLGQPYWQERVKVVGEPPFDSPEWKSRPIILTFLHTGAFGIIRFWMRARGFRTASLLGDTPTIMHNEIFRPYLEAGDKEYSIEGVPQLFKYEGGIREAIRFLKPGNFLTIALDGGKRGAESDRHDAGGYPIFVKKGACRIAAQTNAIVLPVGVRRTSSYRYEVKFGKPVPDELLQKGDFVAATQHLVSELWPDLAEDPSDLNWTTLEALAPKLQTNRIGWP